MGSCNHAVVDFYGGLDVFSVFFFRDGLSMLFYASSPAADGVLAVRLHHIREVLLAQG